MTTNVYELARLIAGVDEQQWNDDLPEYARVKHTQAAQRLLAAGFSAPPAVSTEDTAATNERETLAEPVPPMPRLLVVPSEQAMYDLLCAVNVSGHNPELACTWTYHVGSPRGSMGAATFLATLTDPDADHVNYIYADESGHSRCVVGCEDCGSEGYRDDAWRPTYPVSALLPMEPDAERCREDDISTWWTRLAATQRPHDREATLRERVMRHEVRLSDLPEWATRTDAYVLLADDMQAEFRAALAAVDGSPS